ncbi:MAG: tetratricopeptide repeat protein [bacterium]
MFNVPNNFFIYLILMYSLFFLMSPPICKAQLSEEDTIYKIALGSYRDGFIDMAIEQFQEFITRYPESSKTSYARFRLGDCFIEKKEYQRAGEYYSKNIQLNINHNLYKPSLYRLAESLLFQKKFSSSAQYFEQFIEKYPDDELSGDALFYLAESLYQIQDYHKALGSYERLLQKYKNHPKGADSLYSAGWCLIKLQKYKDAIEKLMGLIKRYPDSPLIPDAQKKIADSYYTLQDYREAEKYYSTYLDTNPKDEDSMGQAILNKGISLSFLNRHKEAINVYDSFLKKYNKHALAPLIFFQRALYLYTTERLDEAKEAFHTIGTEYKKNNLLNEKKIAASLYYSGLIKEKLKDYEGANAAFKRLIAEYPSLKEKFIYDTFLKLGSLAYNDNHLDTAVEFYKRALQSDEDKSIAAEAAYSLADCYFALKQPEEGIALLQKFELLYPDEKSWGQMASFRLGNIYEEEEKWESALKEYQKAAQGKVYKGLVALAEKGIKRMEEKINHD